MIPPSQSAFTIIPFPSRQMRLFLFLIAFLVILGIAAAHGEHTVPQGLKRISKYYFEKLQQSDLPRRSHFN